MNDRVALSFLLVENGSEDPPVEPIVPFPALYLEDPRICTAVLERTAILASTTDQYERVTARHDQVYVDPSMVEWRTITSDSQGNRLVMPSGKGRMAKDRQPASQSPWRQTNGLVMSGDQERKAARDLSDERALKNQQEVRSTEEKEMRFLRQRSAEQATEKEKEEVNAIETPMQIVSANTYSGSPMRVPADAQKKVKLRHCHRCGLDKPKGEFKTKRGKGVCEECRAKPELKVGRATGEPRVGTEIPLGEVVAISATPTKRKYTRHAKAGGKRKYTRRAAPVAPVHSTGHRNGRPSLTLKELMTSVKGAIAERDELRKEVAALRQEKAELYAQLQEVVG